MLGWLVGWIVVKEGEGRETSVNVWKKEARK